MHSHLRGFWPIISSLAISIALFLAAFIPSVGAHDGNPLPAPILADKQNSVQAATNSQPPADAQTFDGMITDTHCGAKHKPTIDMTAADCTRACVHAGAQFALVDGDSTYVLHGDRQELKQAAGTRVHIIGSLRGNAIQVSSVRPEL